jgi:uncharacterized protein YndB with AHSA1/START domain
MKILKIILIAIVAIIGIGIILGYTLGGDMQVEKETTIEAPVERVYALIATPKLRSDWDPWLALDPSAEITFEGPESGIGAINSWSSQNEGLGNGMQEIIDARDNEYIRTRVTMDMMQMPIYSEFKLSPTTDGATKVVWSMEGEAEGMGPFAPFMAWIGEIFVAQSFEMGLINLETEALKPVENTNTEEVILQ